MCCKYQNNAKVVNLQKIIVYSAYSLAILILDASVFTILDIAKVKNSICYISLFESM